MCLGGKTFQIKINGSEVKMKENEEIIKTGSLLNKDDMNSEFKDRRKDYLIKSIDQGEQIPEEWEIEKEYKTRRKIYRNKTIHEALQDKIWKLFYLMGPQYLSTRNLSLKIKDTTTSDANEYIDVLAVFEDTIFVTKCESLDRLDKKNMKGDIDKYSDKLSNIRNSLIKLLKQKYSIIFILATENINWDEDDKTYAEENKIIVWDEYDIDALLELTNLAGEGAKYQIYNRIFFNRKIKNFEITIPALKAKMGGFHYYLFAMNPEHLLKISYVHQRSGKGKFLDISESYQRMLNKKRVRKIEEYIKEGGFFPGSIIVNFNRNFQRVEKLGKMKRLQDVELDAEPVTVTLPPYYGCAWIIDGQHRLYGYADTENKKTETIPVVAFVEEPRSLQTKIFVDINKNQKPIESNLLWDLYEDLYEDSTNEKERELYCISVIAKKLNNDKNSPFYNSITIPKEENQGNISLTTICNSIKTQRFVSGKECPLFYEDYEKTIDYAAERIECFFNIIKKELPEEWELGDEHYFKTNAGLVVLMGIFRDIIDNLSREEELDIKKFVDATKQRLEPLLLYFLDLDNKTIQQYRGAGGAGQKSRQVRAELTRVIKNAKMGFYSRWLEKYEDVQRDKEEFAKKKKGLKYYLDKAEGKNLEFKGSLLVNLNRYLIGDGQIKEDKKVLKEGVLKTIVAFLNTDGGDIVVGILERNKFENADEEKISDCPEYKDKIVFGIDIEYKKDEWDGYLSRLVSFIEKRISDEIIDSELVEIKKLKYENKEVCLINVSPSDSKQFLDGKEFYIRRKNKSQLLEGPDIDRYWKKRK